MPTRFCKYKYTSFVTISGCTLSRFVYTYYISGCTRSRFVYTYDSVYFVTDLSDLFIHIILVDVLAVDLFIIESVDSI